MIPIRYILGDATKPMGYGRKITVRATYDDASLYLGDVRFIETSGDIVSAQMAVISGTELNYTALYECLTKVRDRALATKATVHGPRFGAGLAGGQWGLVADTIKSELGNHDVPVFIYDLEASDA